VISDKPGAGINILKVPHHLENVFHEPVMVSEVLEYLQVFAGGKYIDCTLGGGGHTRHILEKGGRVLGLDQDPEAISRVGKHPDLIIYQSNFSQLAQVAKEHGFDQVNGILYDLGMSSYQLDQSGRGFSFQKEEPLDMRMDPGLSVCAADLVNALSSHELEQLFKQLGQERRSRTIAKAIVRARDLAPIETTSQLVKVITDEVPVRRGAIHPATRVFQALRMAVNGELPNLKNSLLQAVPLLSSGGRLVIISFHSLEDRLAKELKSISGLKALTKKPLRPSEDEVRKNPRARSARLRAHEKM